MRTDSLVKKRGLYIALKGGKCIAGITANKEHCRRQVENSIGVITAICPYVGYETAANIAKEALRTGRQVKIGRASCRERVLRLV